MKLTAASSYAVQALAHMARLPPGAWGQSRTIALAAGLSEGFLGRVLGALVKAGLARSAKGPGGGYGLARAPEEISLLEIIEAAHGPIRSAWAGVVAGGATALDRRLQRLSDEAVTLVRERLAGVTLAELARGMEGSKG